MGKLLTKKVWYLVSGDDIGDGVKVSVLDIFFGFGDNWQVDFSLSFTLVISQFN